MSRSIGAPRDAPELNLIAIVLVQTFNNMIKHVTPEILKRIIFTETRPVMFVCVDAGAGIKKVETILNQAPGALLKQIEICVADVDHMDDRTELSEKFNVFGTPSIVLYHLGKVKDTFLGQFDPDDLVFFLEANL